MDGMLVLLCTSILAAGFFAVSKSIDLFRKASERDNAKIHVLLAEIRDALGGKGAG